MTTPRWLRLPLAVLALSALAAVGGTLAAGSSDIEPVEAAPAIADGAIDSGGPSDDVERIRANVAFWSRRSQTNPRDFVSATRWATAEVELARSTGDVTRYVAAEEAVERALGGNPGFRPALETKAAILVALHRFNAAREVAQAVLLADPANPSALAALGDASLAVGDVDVARGCYQQLSVVADSAASRARRGHLAFVDGDPASAADWSRSAVDAALDEGLAGSALAWYRYQLGDVLASTGDLRAARQAFVLALTDEPASPLAHWGLARIAAADARWDVALDHLDAAIAIVPLPDSLARRADIYRLRGAPGDERRERADRRTVLAIGQLTGDAAGVYDRTLSLYLSSHGEDPARALRLAESELAVRKDVYGYDALAWALLANGRADEARDQMAEALALGTRDARLFYHAGIIEARLGHDAAARTYLEDALATDPSFDPLAVRSARAVLRELE